MEENEIGLVDETLPTEEEIIEKKDEDDEEELSA